MPVKKQRQEAQKRQQAAAANKIICRAKELLGLPWVHQGRNPNLGLDCAGLCIEVLRTSGVIIDAPADYGRAANPEKMQYIIDTYCDKVSHPMGGDFLLIKFRHTPRHLGIVIDKKTMIHSYENKGVIVQELNRFWTDRIVGIYRIKPKFINL